jgi:hypothetical protein
VRSPSLTSALSQKAGGRRKKSETQEFWNVRRRALRRKARTLLPGRSRAERRTPRPFLHSLGEHRKAHFEELRRRFDERNARSARLAHLRYQTQPGDLPRPAHQPRPLTFLILRRSSSAPEKSNTAPVKKIDLACTIVSDLDLSANGRLPGGVQTAAKIALRVYLRREG